MAKIKSPDKSFNGEAYGIKFVDGIAETEDTYLISRLITRGYKVVGKEKLEEEPKEKEENLEELEYNELQDIAKKLDIKANQSTEDLIKAIKEVRS